MTHTYFHARSSARIWGGEPEDYLAVHDWMDATKKVYCDFRHRALRHHSEGIFVGEDVFGTTVENSVGKQVPVRYVLEQHVIEDSGVIPTVQDWFRDMPLKDWMFAPDGKANYAYSHAEASAEAWGGEPEDYLPVHDWFDETQRVFADPRSRALRHHAEGIFFCEERLGKAITNADGARVPVRAIAEAHVRRNCGRIPAAEDYLKLIPRRGWMARATKIRHSGSAGHGVRRGQ